MTSRGHARRVGLGSQQALGLGHQQGPGNALAGCIAQGHAQLTLGQFDEVIEVAANPAARTQVAAELVAGQDRGRGRVGIAPAGARPPAARGSAVSDRSVCHWCRSRAYRMVRTSSALVNSDFDRYSCAPCWIACLARSWSPWGVSATIGPSTLPGHLCQKRSRLSPAIDRSSRRNVASSRRQPLRTVFGRRRHGQVEDRRRHAPQHPADPSFLLRVVFDQEQPDPVAISSRHDGQQGVSSRSS